MEKQSHTLVIMKIIRRRKMHNSVRQLANEKYAAEHEGYDIAVVKADMSYSFPFADHVFDMIFHPVANFAIQAYSAISSDEGSVSSADRT